MTKIFFIFSLAAALPAVALATSSTSIELPVGFTGEIWTNFNSSFSGLSSYTNLIIGVILVLLVIGELILMLRHPNK